MKLKFWMMPVAAIMFFASCNNEGTKTDSDDTVVTTTTTTDNNMTTTGEVVVPDNTRTTFTTKYPTATNVTWKRYDPSMVPIEWEWSGWTTLDTSDYVVSFNVDGSDYWVWYDESGNWIGEVSTVKDHSSLPAAVNNAIKSKYSGYTIVSVDKENDKDRTAYEVELDKSGEKAIVLFDANGNVLKSKTADGKTKVDQK